MAAFRVTREAIFAAADARAAVGEAPTLAGVRGDVGGGSFTTISEAMKEWRAKRAEKSATPTVIREPAPDFVNARIESFAAELWSSVTQKADEKLQAERDAMSQARDDLENQKREAAELADQMEADLQVARDQNEVNTAELDKFRSQITSIFQDLNKEIAARSLSESRANTAEAALAESHAALETAKAAVDRAVSDLAAERQARTQAEIDARAKSVKSGLWRGVCWLSVSGPQISALVCPMWRPATVKHQPQLFAARSRLHRLLLRRRVCDRSWMPSVLKRRPRWRQLLTRLVVCDLSSRHLAPKRRLLVKLGQSCAAGFLHWWRPKTNRSSEPKAPTS